MNFKKREETFRKNLKSDEAFLVLNKEDIYYLSGFYGSFGVFLITKGGSVLFVDGRYYEKAKKETDLKELVLTTDFWNDLKTYLKGLRIKRICFDGETLAFAFYRKLIEEFSDLTFYEDKERLIKKMREIKDEDEIELIKSAIKKSQSAYKDFVTNINLIGLKETECVNELDYRLKRKGEGISFETLVLSGKNSSLPHGSPGSKKVKKGDSVIIDFGLRFKNYCTDHTRTIIFDNPEMENCLKIVKSAFTAGLSKIGHGKEIKDVDMAVRNIFEKYGVLKNFLHSSGHGIGLSVHESPAISYKTKGVFKKGMIVTLEPGLYFEGIGGVRYEEMILVTKSGCEIL
ncbi:MAG: Xaa-Pro peptidase family protein [Proteobacteria bacterium]|nr:Xaa-Pro peptidase family protein [Pseudomonadota bacterium]